MRPALGGKARRILLTRDVCHGAEPPWPDRLMIDTPGHGGGRKFTSCNPASRTTSAGSGTLLIARNSSHNRRVGLTQNMQVTVAAPLLKIPCGMARGSRIRS